MALYKVAVTETNRRIVTVRASNEEEAHQRVYDAWSGSEFLLTDEDFDGVEVYVIGETDRVQGTSIDGKEI